MAKSNHPVLTGDLDRSDELSLRTAAEILAESVHDSIAGLVPYHASGFARYLKAALTPPSEFRTVVVRGVKVAEKLVAVADWRLLDSCLFLNGLAVSEMWRGKGLGRRLIADGEQIARDHGLATIALDVQPSNTPAVSLYRRAGFAEVTSMYWYDEPITPPGSAMDPPRSVDWPQFNANISAYGFGDLTVRDATGGLARIRLVEKAMRIDIGRPVSLDINFIARTLDAARAFSLQPTDAYRSRRPFATFVRMSRTC
jgi:GNAT superfamily N-acetyltransferase